MAAGKVITGFSKPYVAKYNYSDTTGTITYSNGQKLARGVSVSVSAETSDTNYFYADNVVAESAAGTFTGGELNLTVDGLFQEAEQLIMGLPAADEAGFVAYNDNQAIPEVGIGFIVRYQSAGVESFCPVIFPRTAFQLPGLEAATQEESKDWQTQELTATIMRAQDSDRNWRYVGGEDLATETAAEAKIKTFLGIE